MGLRGDGQQLVDGGGGDDGVGEGEEDGGGLRGGEFAGAQDVVVVLQVERFERAQEV